MGVHISFLQAWLLTQTYRSTLFLFFEEPTFVYSDPPSKVTVFFASVAPSPGLHPVAGNPCFQWRCGVTILAFWFRIAPSLSCAFLHNPGGLSMYEELLISHGHRWPRSSTLHYGRLRVGCPETSTVGEHILVCEYFGFEFSNFIHVSVFFTSNFYGGKNSFKPAFYQVVSWF